MVRRAAARRPSCVVCIIGQYGFVVSLVWKEAIDNFLRDVDENIFAGVDTGMSKILDERLGLFGRHGAGGGSEAATLGPQ